MTVLFAKKLSFVVRTEKAPNADGEPEFETTTTIPAARWPMPLEFTVSEASKDRRICIDVIFPDGFQCAISGFPTTIA